MYIFIMRHGDAIPSQLNDPERPLSEYGQKQSQQTAKWLTQFCQVNHVKLNLALSSSFVRAQQTLEQVKQHFDIYQVSQSKELRPTGNKYAAHSFIDSILSSSHNVSAMLIVSHMPLVSYLIDEICHSQLSKLLPTGAVICIDYDPDCSVGYVVDQFMPD